jgi:hypothetical protein
VFLFSTIRFISPVRVISELFWQLGREQKERIKANSRTYCSLILSSERVRFGCDFREYYDYGDPGSHFSMLYAPPPPPPPGWAGWAV